jgi:hypothetical protein
MDSNAPRQHEVTLHLEPGLHCAGYDIDPAEDIPPDPIQLTVPLYPGARPTERTQERPQCQVPASLYLKSATAVYEVPASKHGAETWYRAAFQQIGFEVRGWGTATLGSNPTDLVQGLHFERSNAPHLAIDLSFQTVEDGWTHVLYLASAETLPPRPAESYLHGEFERVQITYVPWADPDHQAGPGRPRLYQILTNREQIAELVGAINTYPQVVGASVLLGANDTGQGAWMVFEPVIGTPTLVELRPAHRLVYVGHASALLDQWSKVWEIVTRTMDEEGS